MRFTTIIGTDSRRLYWVGADCLLRGLWFQWGRTCVRIVPTNRFKFWLTGYEDADECLLKIVDKYHEIEALARRHDTPAVNPGAHLLAVQIVEIIERQ